MRNSENIWNLVEERKQAFIELSDRIWDMPELLYNEHRSCAEHASMLEQQGFRVTREVAGIPTAVMGEAGEEGPVIAFLGEYDALPGLSQESGVAERRPVTIGGHGHGCGHNLLGAGALLAAAAVKDWLQENGVKARVRYYGCPAEEGGAAKTFMVRAGAFRDVDAAITWHPFAWAGVQEADSLAMTRIDFAFTGRSSHAAAAPHLGRSALDAVELMNVGVNYMREHMPSDARIHYAYLNAGGIAPNVVQGEAKIRYAVRAHTLHEMFALIERVRKIADGAALMTETTVAVKILSATANLLGNAPLEQVMQDNFMRLGPVPFDEADRDFARQIQATLSPQDIASNYNRSGFAPRKDLPLTDAIQPPIAERMGASLLGSTDVGDVSWVVPTVQASGATEAIGTPAHSWQWTAQGKMPAAHKGMVHVAKVMAGTALDLINNPALLTAAKADLAARTAATPYVCPIPENVAPPLAMASGG
ncbi:M20 family metallopeptidase [Teichococcus vastitatis]|uniref:M20 family metallopeptidase n=1 Tax=Teichococcus vastitatis TaxID=2307076 RepID=A0ABS9W4V3_9PROT|nr:M20 family metallopeptidase [Pseudoroseomonas vastitatis]MCI0754304.1 M20 family metallopeptidase [Pseudoroseomonas vastitatis]